MSKIVIENLWGKAFNFKGSSYTVLDILHENQLDWMHACGGKGRCTTCKMKIIEGANNLNDMTPAEIKYKSQSLLAEDERLACQAIPGGIVVIRVPEENKLPHLNYSD